MEVLSLFKANVPETTVRNPKPEYLLEKIDQLDGVNELGLLLRSGLKLITVSCSTQERCFVSYMEFSEHDSIKDMGILLDFSETSDVEVRFRLENGEVDIHPMRETVDKGIARVVAHYFRKNKGALPEGLTWYGLDNANRD